MTPRIEILSDKVLVGKRITTSLTENRIGELWKSFMPHRGKIFNAVSRDLISAQTNPSSYFSDFKPSNTFEKWAAVEVFDADTIPDDLETFTIRGGLYAVFEYKGPGGDSSIFQYIFGTWIPASIYQLDDRPHFEVLGPNYKNNDPASEEEIWIPVKQKSIMR